MRGLEAPRGLTPARARELAAQARRRGQQVVAVQGLGFVGAAVAAAIAAARAADGSPRFLVFGVDLGAGAGADRIDAVEAGRSPVTSPDASLGRLIEEAVRATGNLRATSACEVYGLADVIVVDVQLDVVSSTPGDPSGIALDRAGFEAALRAIGATMRADTLVVVESTVPLGACQRWIGPVLERERAARGIGAPLRLAHAYERVMPGPRHVDSVRRFGRSVTALDAESLALAREFLASFVDVGEHPLRELGSPAASEMAKLLENSYRAVNIAFIDEWARLAERAGVNLFEVVDSIRVRRGTHDNIREPGFGVGGYCLTKDSLLAQWGARHLLGADVVLGMTLEALRINHEMPRHSLALAAEVAGGSLAGKRILLCGVSYLPGVGDSRNSPAASFASDARDAGACVVVHDPCLARWIEHPEFEFAPSLAAIEAVDVVVLAVAHPEYVALDPRALLALGSPAAPVAVVDAVNALDDAKAARLRAAGCRIAGVGKGHWRALGHQEPR